MFQVELIWNREFHFVPYGSPFQDLEKAINYSLALGGMGDGASVKSTRIVDQYGRLVYIDGRRIKPELVEEPKRKGADMVCGFDCLG